MDDLKDDLRKMRRKMELAYADVAGAVITISAMNDKLLRQLENARARVSQTIQLIRRRRRQRRA